MEIIKQKGQWFVANCWITGRYVNLGWGCLEKKCWWLYIPPHKMTRNMVINSTLINQAGLESKWIKHLGMNEMYSIIMVFYNVGMHRFCCANPHATHISWYIMVMCWTSSSYSKQLFVWCFWHDLISHVFLVCFYFRG